MADEDTTATADKPKTDESAADDPGMAAFLEEKRGKEAGDKSADKPEDDKSDDDKGAAASDDADKGSDDDSKEDSDKDDSSADDKSEPGDSKADDDSTAKEQNRLGYQLRQIRGNDPFVARAKKALTDDYVNAEGLTEDQREIRQMKADNYLEKLERQRAQLVSDSQQIAEEFPFFNPADKENFQKDLYDRAMARFGRDSLQMSDPDEQGKQEIIGYKTRLLDYLREEADLVQAGRSQGKGKSAPDKPAKKDASTDKSASDKKKSDADAKMDAASEEPGGASTAKSDSAEEEDPMLKSFLAGMDSVK